MSELRDLFDYMKDAEWKLREAKYNLINAEHRLIDHLVKSGGVEFLKLNKERLQRMILCNPERSI